MNNKDDQTIKIGVKTLVALLAFLAMGMLSWAGKQIYDNAIAVSKFENREREQTAQWDAIKQLRGLHFKE